MNQPLPLASVLDIVIGVPPSQPVASMLTREVEAALRFRLAAFRTHDDQRREIAAEVAAEDGRAEDLGHALRLVEHDLAHWRVRAEPDPIDGSICPTAAWRMMVLMARKTRLLALAERFPRP